MKNVPASKSIHTEFCTNSIHNQRWWRRDKSVTKFNPNSKPRLTMKIAKFKPNPIPQLTQKKSLRQLLAGKEGRQWNGQYRLLLCHFDIVVGWPSTLLYPISLSFGFWDRVQGGDPLYGPVKYVGHCWGQERLFWTNFFAKCIFYIYQGAVKKFSSSFNRIYPRSRGVKPGGGS